MAEGNLEVTEEEVERMVKIIISITFINKSTLSFKISKWRMVLRIQPEPKVIRYVPSRVVFTNTNHVKMTRCLCCKTQPPQFPFFGTLLPLDCQSTGNVVCNLIPFMIYDTLTQGGTQSLPFKVS